DHNRKAKPRGQPVFDSLPGVARVPRPIHPGVILPVDDPGIVWIVRETMNAIADLGCVPVLHDAVDSAILRLPACSTIIRAPDTDGRDAAPDPLGPVRIDEDGVRAQSTRARKPGVPCRMIVEPRNGRPRLAVILAREKPGDIDAGVVTLRRAVERPDLIELAVAALGIRGPALDLPPVLQVGTGVQRRPVHVAGGRDQVASTRRSR